MKTIGDIILQDSNRGMKELSSSYPFLKNTPLKAADELKKLKKGTVFIYTGFFVNHSAETDGPIGAYFLYKTLKKMGFNPIIITDKYCKDFFPKQKIIYIPTGKNPLNDYKKLLNKYKPVAHISIERCGKNTKGAYLNHKGEDISAFSADIDELFKLGGENSLTIAVGDGGNEIGMGNFSSFFKEKNTPSYCNVTCDIPIVASVSNWGAYALIASIDKESIPTFEEADSYLEYIVSKGAVDGIYGLSKKSVDAKDWNLEKEILSLLKSYMV